MNNAGLIGCKVLVVEDEALILMMIEDALTDIGCEIADVATRFEEAQEKVRESVFDVVLLDVNLNGRRTFDIAQMLIEKGRHVLFSTGYQHLTVPESLRAVPVLHKPFQQHDLLAALHKALSFRDAE